MKYKQFFATLGIGDSMKVHKLARLLQVLYETASQLDGHLVSVGAALHVAVSRMIEPDNPLAPSQLRWIRVIDRLNVFCDSDEHACRAVNIGMAYAYRHKELDALTAANAFRLSDVHLSAGRGRGTTAGGAMPSRAPGAGASVAGSDCAPSGIPAACPSVGIAAQPYVDDGPTIDRLLDQNDAMVVPLGGLVVRRPVAGSGENEEGDAGPLVVGTRPRDPKSADRWGAAVAADSELNLDNGGIVIARGAPAQPRGVGGPAGSHPNGVAAAHVAKSADQAASVGQSAGPGQAREARHAAGNGQVLAVNPIEGAAAAVVAKEQPIVHPSPEAVACVTTVLEGLAIRADVRDELDELVVDSLLCLVRLHGGMTASFSAGIAPATVELAWVGVRNFLHRWWPIWEADAAGDVRLAPPRTVSFLSHPGRRVRVSRWALEVDISSINEAIARLEVPSSRYFKKDTLPSSSCVVRVGPNTRPSICTSVATLLLVATKEAEFCAIVAQLSTLGRAPVSKDASMMGATCHDFESAGLADPDARGGMPIAPRVDRPGASASEKNATSETSLMDAEEEQGQQHPVGLAPMEEIEGFQKEMELLLQKEVAAEGVVSRAVRLAKRRSARPHREQEGSSVRPAADPSASVQRFQPRPTPKPLPPSIEKLQPQSTSKGQRTGDGASEAHLGPDPLSLLHMCPPRRSHLLVGGDRAQTSEPEAPAGNGQDHECRTDSTGVVGATGLATSTMALSTDGPPRAATLNQAPLPYKDASTAADVGMERISADVDLFTPPPTFQGYLAEGGGESVDGGSHPSSSDDEPSCGWRGSQVLALPTHGISAPLPRSTPPDTSTPPGHPPTADEGS